MLQEEHFDTKPKALGRRKLPTLPSNPEQQTPGRFPSWLHREMPKGENLFSTDQIVKTKRLHTVCEEARCPNRLECYTNKTATFLAMGKECTRGCGFCDIETNSRPPPLEEDEPERIAASAKELGLEHVVITMVARDDLPDGGANQIVKIVAKVRQEIPGCTIELLTSDFAGNKEAWKRVLESRPEVFNHNIETVRRLSPRVRHKATYDRTLSLLRYAKESGIPRYVKSGLMLGLGEEPDEVKETLADLKEAGCDIVTMGQYLQASRHKLRVKAFIHPDEFKNYEEYGISLGMRHMYCGPFVRSSYNAGLLVK